MRTPLMLACTSISPEAAKKAKRKDADVLSQVEVAKVLLDSGADPNGQCEVLLTIPLLDVQCCSNGHNYDRTMVLRR